MSRPGVGNPGNKGGGRKSAYQEKQAAAWHDSVWSGKVDLDELERRIQSRIYSGQDIAALRLLKGDKTIVAKFMDKLMPDAPKSIDLTSLGEKLAAPIINYIKPDEPKDNA